MRKTTIMCLLLLFIVSVEAQKKTMQREHLNFDIDSTRTEYVTEKKTGKAFTGLAVFEDNIATDDINDGLPLTVQANFVAGYRNGPTKMFFDSGKLAYRANYEGGKKQGSRHTDIYTHCVAISSLKHHLNHTQSTRKAWMQLSGRVIPQPSRPKSLTYSPRFSDAFPP